MGNGFKKALSGIDKAIHEGAKSALNKAAKEASKNLVRALSSDTGLAQKDINPRMATFKASGDGTLKATVSVATKVGIPLRKLSPKTTIVETKRGPREAVTAKVGGSQTLIPGAFLLPTGVVAGRKLAFTDLVYTDSSAARTPTVELRSDILTEAAKARQPEAQEYMADVVDQIIDEEIESALSKRFSEG